MIWGMRREFEGNSWLATRTLAKLITTVHVDIIPDGAVDPVLTKIILANAIYFKGIWVRKFHADLRREGEFYLLNGGSVRAPLMMSVNVDRHYVEFYDGFRVCKLPYQRGEDERRFSMYIYLPDALSEPRERVCSESGFINTHLPSSNKFLAHFRVPKFKFEFGFKASDTFKELGVVMPFHGGELTEMVEPDYDYPLS